MTKGPMMHHPMLQETVEVIAETLGAERDRITEPEAFLDVLAEGGGGPDFLGRSAQKVVLVRRSVTPAIAA